MGKNEIGAGGALLVLCIGLTGCGDGRGHHGGGGDFPTAGVALAAVAAAEMVASVAAPPPGDPDSDPGGYAPGPPTFSPPPPPVIQSLHPSFEAAAAVTAIAGVDYGVCRRVGAPVGWYHARVTYEPDGSVSRVIVDWTPGIPPLAIACLREQVKTAQAPPFEGAAVTVGAPFFVPWPR